jgi:hypothetical protein
MLEEIVTICVKLLALLSIRGRGVAWLLPAAFLLPRDIALLLVAKEL